MKRQASQRVIKRDGRTEWLRVTKLARSIGRAISTARGVDYDVLYPRLDVGSADVGEAWHTLEVGSAVLAGLRQTMTAGAALSSEAISEAVQQVLFATGLPGAAEAYARVGGEQLRRSLVLEATMPSLRRDRQPSSRQSGASSMRSSPRSNRASQPGRSTSNPNDFRRGL